MWLEVWVLQSDHLHSDPGFTLLSNVVLEKLPNLLVPQLSISVQWR